MDLWNYKYCEECFNGTCMGVYRCNCTEGWKGDFCDTGTFNNIQSIIK